MRIVDTTNGNYFDSEFKIKMTAILQKTQQKNSYAHVADQPEFPTKEQTIILDSIEGITT